MHGVLEAVLGSISKFIAENQFVFCEIQITYSIFVIQINFSSLSNLCKTKVSLISSKNQT
jgi:hypothetical protein